MRIVELLELTGDRLQQAGIEEFQSEARLLLQESLGLTRSQLYLRLKEEVSPTAAAACEGVIRRRLQREPLAYILGKREFWSLDFQVGPGVLVPRPETEFLLTCVLDEIQGNKRPADLVLDLCTGSGVIATVLARELPCRVMAIDLSAEALVYAEKNIRQHGVHSRVQLVHGDLFAPLAPLALVDVLVSNPPYVDENELPRLAPEVRCWEPRQALAAGSKGMDCLVRIVDTAWQYLRPGGLLCCEIGADQEGDVLELFASQEQYTEATVRYDWADRPRVVMASRRPVPTAG